MITTSMTKKWEMELDQSTGQVDEHRRGGHQTQGRDHGPQSPAELVGAGRDRRDGDRRGVERAVRETEALYQPVDERSRHMQNQHPQDHPVAQPPLPFR